jgi:ribose transport system substrate-binding protein
VKRSFVSRGRRLGMVAVAATASLAVAACGSSSNKSSTSSASGSSTTASGGASSDAVAQAKKVVAMSDGKLVYSSKVEPGSPADIVPYGTWRGPTSAPAHQAGKNLQIIVCTKQSVACVQAAQGAQKAAQKIGWKAQIIDGGGTPQGFATAFNTALSNHADAIMTIAVPTAAVGSELAQTKKAGVPTIAVGDKEPASGTKYDAYVPFPMPLMNATLAYADIADNNGKANTIVVQDPGFPVLIQSAAEYRKILGTCSGCKSSSKSMQITDASDPTKVQTVMQGALSQDPNATTIALPYAISLPATVQAVKTSGKNVAVVAKDGDEVGLKAVADGSSKYNAGSSVVWAGWAGIDQAIRLIAHKTPLGPTQTGLGVALFSQSTAPKNGNIDTWPGLVNYQAQYEKIWK